MIQFVSNEKRYKSIELYDENKSNQKNIIRYAYAGTMYNTWIVKPKQNGFLRAYFALNPDKPDPLGKLMITQGLTVSLTSSQLTSLNDNQFVRINNNTSGLPQYEPYHKYDIPIVVRGKNLIKYPYATASRTMNGVKYTVNKDGSVTVVGTATAASYFILNGNVDFGNSSIPENSTNGVYATSEGVRYNVGNHTVSINVASGETVDKIVYPQIEYGTTATVYEPYIEETTHIYLNEPLRKIGDYADYIDFKNKRVVRNIVKRSLDINGIYKKLNNVIRFSGVAGYTQGKLDYHMRSTIFRNISGFYNDTESIFHHTGSTYAYYWSVYWQRLGLTYDGANVYRTDDTEQTPLTDSEIINIAKQWLNTLSDKDREVYIILDTPTKKSTTLTALKTFKGTNIISVDTNISPSNIHSSVSLFLNVLYLYV